MFGSDIAATPQYSSLTLSKVSSGVWADKIPLEKAYHLAEVGGGRRTMKEELKRIGYRGQLKANHAANPIGVRIQTKYHIISV